MTDLEKLLLGGMGVGIVGLAGFAARILWVILPRYLEQNERNTLALQWISYSMGQLPKQLEQVLVQSLAALKDTFREEHARTRADLTGQVDELREVIERRLSGQEGALQATQLELARAGVTGKLQAVSASQAEQLTDEQTPPDPAPPPPPSRHRGSASRP